MAEHNIPVEIVQDSFLAAVLAPCLTTEHAFFFLLHIGGVAKGSFLSIPLAPYHTPSSTQRLVSSALW
jgi:hypothetical protein